MKQRGAQKTLQRQLHVVDKKYNMYIPLIEIEI